MLSFAERVRDGSWRVATVKRITNIVNIGIGGSDLGPRLVCTALAPMIDGPRPHFVANIDGAELHAVLSRLRPETTLFVLVSKTFAPQERTEERRVGEECGSTCSARGWRYK